MIKQKAAFISIAFLFRKLEQTILLYQGTKKASIKENISKTDFIKNSELLIIKISLKGKQASDNRKRY